jgi:hypothetical protein
MLLRFLLLHRNSNSSSYTTSQWLFTLRVLQLLAHRHSREIDRYFFVAHLVEFVQNPKRKCWIRTSWSTIWTAFIGLAYDNQGFRASRNNAVEGRPPLYPRREGPAMALPLVCAAPVGGREP